MNGRPAGLSDSDSDYEDYGFGDPIANYEDRGDDEAQNEARKEWLRKAYGSSEEPIFLERLGNEKDSENLSLEEKFCNALTQGDIKVVSECLDKDLKLLDKDFANFSVYGTPLNNSSSHANVELTKYLMEKGASVKPDSLGVTPFMAIFMKDTRGNEDLEKRLIQCAEMLLPKVDINHRQNQNMTSLMMAANNGSGLLVSFLLSKGADINLRDSQDWTALCFAADKGHGRVCRILLEAGADPDEITSEGKTASELAGNHEYFELQEVISQFEKRQSLIKGCRSFKNKKRESSIVQSYTELDYILMALRQEKHIPSFKEHNIDFEKFLALSEADLIEIGITKVGDRKSIIDGISKVHKQDWEKSSLPRLTPKDRSRGIYLTCPDCVTIVANISQHLKFISANMFYIERQVTEHPEILEYGQDIASVHQVDAFLKDCRSSGSFMTKRIASLSRLISKHSKKPGLRRVDLVEEEKCEKLLTAKKTVFVISILMGCCFIYYRMKN